MRCGEEGEYVHPHHEAKHFQGPKSQSFQEITYADEIAPSCVPKVSQIFA